MTITELIDKYSNGPSRIKQALSDLSPDQMHEKQGSGQWSIHEHVIHLVDSDVSNFIRLKSVLAQPGCDVFVIDEDAWIQNIDSRNESLEEYLELFTMLRSIMTRFLQRVPEPDWTDSTIRHTCEGKTNNLTLRDMVSIYADHVDFHLEYIEKLASSTGKDLFSMFD
jgi:uncharacterized damage-inducible protein DinB